MYYIDSKVSKETFLQKKMIISVPGVIKDSNNKFSIEEIELMIKNKEHAFSNESLNALSTNDNYFRRFNFTSDKFLGKVIGIVDGDVKGLVQHMCYLYNDNTFEHEFFYTLKNEKTNEFFVLLKKESQDSSIYLSSEEIFDYYKKNKNEIFKTNLIDSVYYYRIAENDYKYRFLNKGVDAERNINIEDLCDVLVQVFPFYKNKLNKSIEYIEGFNSYIYLNNFFYKDYLMPFLNQFPLTNFFSDSFHSINEEILSNIIKQKSDLGSFKQLIPKANKKTMELLNAIISCERNLGRYEDNDYIELGVFNLSVLSIFENSNLLNTFLSLIQSSNENDGYIYFLKESDEVEDFYQNILPSFYSSKVKYQNNIIKTLEMYLEKIESDLNIQDEAYYKGLDELECECGNDEGFCECESDYHLENRILGDNNFCIVVNLMEDSFKSYQALMNSYENQNDEVKKKIDLLLSKKMNDIELIHNELADMVSELEDDNVFYNEIGLKENHIEKDNVELFEVLDNISLKKIGRTMHHCVASYANQIEKGDTSIFAVRKENNFVACLELNNNLNAIAQAKGKYNMKITDKEVLNVIELFINKNKLKVITNDILIKTKL